MPTVAPPSWQSIYPPHACANVYPMLPDDELEELVNDINDHGLKHPIVLWPNPAKTPAFFVLDGRNRLAALARLAIEIPTDPTAPVTLPNGTEAPIFTVHTGTNPARYVISVNIHRRHLNLEERRELIWKTVEAGRIDVAKVARSFSPIEGKKGGSSKDPVVEQAMVEAEKQGISARSMRRTRAKMQGRIPTTTIEPTVTRSPAPPSTYEWVDERNTELRKQRAAATKSFFDTLAEYAKLITEPEFTSTERRNAKQYFVEDLRRIGARVDLVFGEGRPPRSSGSSRARAREADAPQTLQA